MNPSYNYQTKKGIKKVEFNVKNGEFYIDGTKMEGLSIWLWDTLKDHLSKGGPLSHLSKILKGLALNRRTIEAMAANMGTILYKETIKIEKRK